MKQTAAASRISNLISRFAVALAVIFAVGGAAPGVAWATDYEVNDWDTLKSYITSSSYGENDTVKLGEDITSPGTTTDAYFDITANGITIDLGGHSLTLVNTDRFVIDAGRTVTFKSGTLVASGRTKTMFEVKGTGTTLNLNSVNVAGEAGNIYAAKGGVFRLFPTMHG